MKFVYLNLQQIDEKDSTAWEKFKKNAFGFFNCSFELVKKYYFNLVNTDGFRCFPLQKNYLAPVGIRIIWITTQQF